MKNLVLGLGAALICAVLSGAVVFGLLPSLLSRRSVKRAKLGKEVCPSPLDADGQSA